MALVLRNLSEINETADAERRHCSWKTDPNRPQNAKEAL